MTATISRRQVVLRHFRDRAEESISHADAVDAVTAEWERLSGGNFYGVGGVIRSLASEGRLMKTARGMYRYNSDARTHQKPLTAKQKREILERDGGRCLMCGCAEEIGVYRIFSERANSTDSFEYGLTLCVTHGNKLRPGEWSKAGRSWFADMLKAANAASDERVAAFCRQIHGVYKHLETNVNG